MYKKIFTRIIIFYEFMGFALLIVIHWLNEFFDLPHMLFNVKKTPVNIIESIIETLAALILCALTMYITSRFLNHIEYLEGFLPVCSLCKKIRINEQWIPIEEYISKHSKVKFSHGMCPSCAKEYYPEYFDSK